MSLKKLEQTKNSRWFSIWDTIVYGVIILTAAALIISFTIGRDKSALDGFYIVYNGERALVYRFGDEEPTVFSEENIE
ncbi:MAG: hypothetical protein K2L72_03695, partial [Clostridia bacterium]|nr:hypothetical protein [Clostridia bacterium]